MEVMSAGFDSRRRPSTTFRASDDIDENEASKKLISRNMHERAPWHIIFDKSKNANCHHPNYRIRLRRLSLTVVVVFIASFAIFSYGSLLGTTLIKFGPSNAADRYRSARQMLGIELHPEDHVRRKPSKMIYNWNITAGFRTPDGVKKKVYLVNGNFPGPTIECRSGDRLVIHVTNGLFSEGVSIHWHGLHMHGANFMDGAVGMTQCPIRPGELFSYEFDVDERQSGTFWWHSHSQVQRGDGLYGGLIVHTPENKQNERRTYGYEKEVLLLVGDWYHRSAAEILRWYISARGFGNEPVPDSMIINGAGKFNCSRAVPARPVECYDTDGEKRIGILGRGEMKIPMRIRLINVGTLAGITVQATSATLHPIMVDGGFQITGTKADSVGVIYPGERVDLILQWHGSSNTASQFLIYLDPENFKYPNPTLEPNQSFPLFTDESISEFPNGIPQRSASFLDISSTFGLDLSQDMHLPSAADETILLYTKTEKLSINSNHPLGFMNRTSWKPQSTPPRALISLFRSQWDSNQLIPWIPITQNGETWVDIIINNLDDGSHPFHLHGHDFWVLTTHRSEHGWGSYSPYISKNRPELNLRNPVRKDTVSVPRRGYAIIRLRANNPGIWMLHCHVLFHQASGMAMGLQVGGESEHLDIDLRTAYLCENR